MLSSSKSQKYSSSEKPYRVRPAFRASAKLRRARFEFVFEKLSHTIAHFCREPKLVAAGIVIVVRF